VSASTTQLAVAFGAFLLAALLLTSGLRRRSFVEVLRGVTEGRPEGPASSPTSSGPAAPIQSVAGIVNPLPVGFKKGRTDQGVDFSGAAGDPILSMGEGVVTKVSSDFYAGQPAVYYRITSGPLAGRELYAGEQLIPDVHAGQHIKAGQLIARYATSGTAIEYGFARNGAPEAQSRGGYTEGQETTPGKELDAIFSRLGL
jgi:hypothetical protein